MSHLNQPANNLLNVQQNSAEYDPQLGQPDSELNDASNLENLIPKHISRNKRAVIERLVALYKSEAKPSIR